MKKMFIGLGMLALLSGCMSADCFISETAAPRKGERMKLYFRTLKVVQVCEDSVHVIHQSYNGLRIAVVPLENDYVTGTYLRTGLYEYVGPFTYTTIKDANGNMKQNTIRLFKEVKEED